MAGDWLKFEKATPDKPEVFAIASALDLDPDAVVGKLIRIWSWFDTHTTTGNARSVTPALLDRIAGVTGFVLAMCSVGWVEVTDDGVSLPNFDRHTGETAKGRALGAKRASEHRGKSNAPTVTKGVTTPLPREEKRREEIEAKERADARPAKNRGTRLPSDWAPDPDLTQWAIAERPELGLTSEIEKFRDYWAAKAGAGGLKLDWPATFRNWIRNSKSEVIHANRNSSRKLSAVELVEQAIADNERRGGAGSIATVSAG
jgi:hypothetical protein